MEKNNITDKIVYIGTAEINLMDLSTALKEMGLQVDHIRMQIETMNYDESKVPEVVAALQKGRYSLVISHDFCRVIAKACMETDTPYLSWVYDSPQKELFTDQAFYPCNYFFVFDKNDFKRLIKTGLKQVYHSPLGIEPKITYKAIDLQNVYANSISFVGQLYENTVLEDLITKASKPVREEIQGHIDKYFLNWNLSDSFGSEMGDYEVAFWKLIKRDDIKALYPYMEEKQYYNAAVFARILAARERITILNRMAELADTHLYTYAPKSQQLSELVKVHKGVGYGGAAADIYNHSKINLNITLHCIETGACQRVFDVMAAGGFLVSNYQEELAELFEEDKEIVLYRNMEELETKVQYYLAHEEEREQIARNGQKKVLECYGYDRILGDALSIVGKNEKNRTLTYRKMMKLEELRQENQNLTSLKNARVIAELRQVVGYCRQQDELHGIGLLREIIKDVQAVLEQCLNDRYEEAEELKFQLLRIPEIQKDIILLADVLESIVIPGFERWMQSWGGIQEPLENGFVLESTATGAFTLLQAEQQMYLHSNNDPFAEGYAWANSNYSELQSCYHVFGCGLGYHLYELYKLSDGAVPITVYETDEQIIEWAYRFGVLGWIPQEILQVVIVSHEAEFDRMGLDTMSRMCYYQPSALTKPEDTYGAKIRMHMRQQSGQTEGRHELLQNFYRMRDMQIPGVEQLDLSGCKKDVLIVAAGPSFDHNMQRIMDKREEMTVIAVGTIYQKMLKLGIKPDFVVVMDPYKTTMKQFAEVLDQQIPLIVSSVAYWRIARDYQGPVYMAYLDCPVLDAQDYNVAPQDIWLSGGNVSSMAMELGIYMKAKTISFVGLDLGYPEGQSHAAGTARARSVDTTGMQLITGVRGTKVYTDETFHLYLDWIAYRIRQTPQIQYYNWSDCGAKIMGTKEI